MNNPHASAIRPQPCAIGRAAASISAFPRFRVSAFIFALFLAFAATTQAQTYYDMSSGNYSQAFTSIAAYPTNFNGVAVDATGSIPSGTRIVTASTSLAAVNTSTGIQNNTNNLLFLVTGGTDNTGSIACDLNLNFTGRTAGNLTADVATVNNQTGNRVGTLRVYYSLNNSTWTEITGTNLPFAATNNVAGSASLNIALPSAISGQSTVKLRFYYHNGTGGTTGSRPKISLDNVGVSSTAPSTAPTGVTTGTAGSITASGATLSTSSVTADGGSAITERGVVYNTAASPTTSNTKVTAAGTTGNFNSTLTGLAASTTYYVRAYATNSVGTTYGSDVSFTTSAAAGPNLSAAILGSALTATYPSSSSGVGFTAAGTNLTENIIVTAQTGYEVSTSLGSGYGASASVGTGTTVYLRFAASRAAGSYNSATAAVLSSSGATDVNVTTSASGNTISKATPTISDAPTASDITYGQTLANSTLSGGTASVNGTFAFSNSTISPAVGTASQNVTFTPADGTNYNTANTSASVTVNKATPTLVFNSANSTTVNGTVTLNATSAAIGAVASTGAVTFTSSNSSIASITSGVATGVAVGSVTITATQAADSNYNQATQTQNFTVSAGPTTLAAGDIAVIGYNASGSPDTITFLILKDLNPGTVFYVCDNEVGTAGGTTWVDTSEVEATFTVSAGQIIAAGTVVVLPWGNQAVSDSRFTWTGHTSGGLGVTGGNFDDGIYVYTGSSPTATPTAFIYFVKGGSSGASAGNVPSGLTDGTTSINPTAAASRYKLTGATYSGTAAQLLSAVGNLSNWESTAPGSASDWTFALTQSQSITFGVLSAVTYGDAPFSLNATASSGLAVSYTSSNASVATVAANGTLTIVGAGNTTITANQTGNATYSAATDVSQTLTVNQKALAITGLTGVNKTYDGLTTASATGTPALSGLVGSDTVTLGGTASYTFSSAAVGTAKSITTTGYTMSGGQSSYYTLTQPTLSANITAASLAITAQNVIKAFGVTLTGGGGSTAFTPSGLQNGETIGTVTITYGTGAAASDAAGIYTGAVTPSAATGGTFTASNYSISYESGNITVSASPTISTSGSLSAVSTTYGTATGSPTSISVSGNNLTGDLSVSVSSGFQISSDGRNYTEGPLTLSATSGTVSSTTISVRLPATASVGSSPYSGNLSISGGGATTASVAIPGSTVTAQALTITGISIADKVYDRTNTATITGTAAYSGLANGESFSVTDTPSASFANSAVGANKSVTVSGYTAPSANYSISQPSGLTANITTEALTVTSAAVTSKTYDGTTAATITGTLSGVILGDTVTLNGTGTFASSDAGTGISVTSTFALGGADASNYSLSQPTGLTGDITKANQTITFGALASKTTADAAFALSATASSGLTVTYASSNSGVATVAGNTVTIVGAGSTTITASQAGGSNYNAATNVSQTLTVTTGPTTLTLGDIAILGFNSNAPDGFAFVTWVELAPNTVIKFTDNGFLSSNSATSASNGRGGENFVTWTNNTGSVIAAGTVITIIDVTPATTSQGSISQTLNGISSSGDQIFAYQGAGNGTTASSSDFGTNSNPSTFTGTILFGLNFGSSWMSTGTPTSNTSYRPSELASTYGSIALTTSSTSRGQYTGARSGLTLPQLKAAVVDPANWTTATGNSGVITLNATAFTIAQAQTITFGALSTKTYGDSSFELAATASSGLGVTYASSDTSVATVSGNTVTILKAGTTTITASQAGDATYAAAPSVGQILTVNQKALTGSFTAGNKTYDGTTSATVATRAVSGKVGLDDVNHTGGEATFDTADVGAGKTVSLVGASLAGVAAANYSLGSVSTTTANITAASVTVTAVGQTKTFGDRDPALTYTSSPSTLVAGNSFTGSLTRAAGEGVGNYAISQGTLSIGDNYTLSFIGANLSITQATPSISMAPTASNITIGQTLANSTLSGGTASVAGTYAFTTPSTAPALGISSQGVTFTPTDSANYTAQTTSLDVGVLCLAPVLTRATLPVAGGFTVNWNAATGAANYTVLHSASKNMTGATSVNTNSTSVAITGLSNGLRYVQVRANNAAGASANSTQQVNQLQSIAAGATSYLSAPGEVGTNTVAGIFGAANEAGLASGATDSASTTILLLNSNGATANTIFYNSNVNQWREGATAMAGTAIAQGKAFMLKNNTGSADYFLLVGTPRTVDTPPPTVSLNAAGAHTLLTTGRTTPTTITNMNLNPGTGAGQFKAATKAKDADKVIVLDQTTGAATNYYHNGTNWMDGLRPVPTAEIPAGQGFFIKKASNSTFESWTLPAE